MQRYFEDRGRFWTFYRKRVTKRWWLTLMTGVGMGLVALSVTYFTKLFTNYKFSYFYGIIELEKTEAAPYGSAFFVLLLFNVFYATIAYAFCYYEPLAAGSGIPEIKCFLNGLNVPRIVSLRALVTKVVGIIFSCSAGLPLGKEGPMVHAGAALAAQVSQARSGICGVDNNFSETQDFRNDKEKRDFAACGTAAGIAAAFGSPIGGVLFSLEEGASFWSTKLTWRCFFCAMTTIFTIFFVNSANTLFGHAGNNGMFSFGEFFSLKEEESNFAVWELFIFTVMGGLGGLMGASFITGNERVHLWREANTTSWQRRYLFVIAITICMTFLSSVLPVAWQTCTPLPVDMEEWTQQEKNLVDELVPLYCTKGTHYNEVASLYLTDSDTAIKQLFHFREIGDHNDSTFSSSALSIFLWPYIIMACVCCGAAVPAGMFVPSLLSGAAFGRLVGHLLHKLDHAHGTFADSGTYALIGATAMTGGISRITISLTIMVLEATGDMQYVLPIMLTVMSARLVGNVFTHGLYDMHIKVKNLLFLEEDDDLDHVSTIDKATVGAIMTKTPICLNGLVRVGDVVELLKECQHNCFPVVDRGSGQQSPCVAGTNGILVGTVSRRVICMVIKHRAFSAPSHDLAENSRSSTADGEAQKEANWPKESSDMDSSILGRSRVGTTGISPLINWGTLERVYPDYPTVHDLTLSPREEQLWIDLLPYTDKSAHRINMEASVPRGYRMFRTLGLRHLVVVSQHNQCVGILTRADLVRAYHQLDDFLPWDEDVDEVEHLRPSSSSSSSSSWSTERDSGRNNVVSSLHRGSNDAHHHNYSPEQTMSSIAPSRRSPDDQAYEMVQMQRRDQGQGTSTPPSLKHTIDLLSPPHGTSHHR